MRPFGQCTALDIANEATAISRLCQSGQCRNIVAVLRHGWLCQDRYHIDMEYCPLNLADKICSVQTAFEYLSGFSSEKGKMEITDALAILSDISSGLIYIHNHRTVHRDLKPNNVLYSDSERCWKIADFGACAEGSSNALYVTSNGRGTSGYRAPELLRNQYTYNNKADIWGLGCILYELFSGTKLFSVLN